MSNISKAELTDAVEKMFTELILEIGKQVTRDYKSKNGIWEGMSIDNMNTRNKFVKKFIEGFEEAFKSKTNSEEYQIINNLIKRFSEMRLVSKNRDIRIGARMMQSAIVTQMTEEIEEDTHD